VVTPTLIGVDGCPAGWISVWKAPRKAVRLQLYGTFADLMRAAPDDAVIAIDIPIGLSAVTEEGGRACEREARRFLGRKASSVFSTPSHAAIHAPDYAAACRIIRAELPGRRGLSKQSWNIADKIREVGRVVKANRRPIHIFESHPEVVFATLAGAPVMASKKKPDGRRARLKLLAGAGFDAAGLLAVRPSGCAPDDVVDAVACLWAAGRIAAGKATVYGRGRDVTGRETGIHV
jgi:predicted RNase H-like nuclease